MVIPVGGIRAIAVAGLPVGALRAVGRQLSSLRNGYHFRRRGDVDRGGVADRQQRHQAHRSNPGFHRALLYRGLF
jgi:hypothetical protein